jgi:hypothetical protein
VKLVLGLSAVSVAISWLIWMAKRVRSRVSPKQALIDFITGSPSESVLSIGLFLFGLLLIAAHFVGSK